MLSSARAVIFDLDGTLVDSLDDIVTHLNDALADRGLPGHARERIEEWVGYGAEYLVAHAVPARDVVAEVLASFRERYRARPVIAARLYDGLADALDTIARGRKLAVLSNKPHEPTVAIARSLLGRWPFEVVTGQRPERPKKPDAGAVLPVLAELGCEPADSVLVGDTEVDVATAASAGMRSIGVTWGFRGRDALAQASAIVDSAAELRALFA